VFFLLFKLVKPALLVAVLVAAYLFTPAIANVSGKALHRSVVGELSGTSLGGPSACTRIRAGRWRCRVLRPQGGSSPASYSVLMRGRRCWAARQTARGTAGRSLARRASGCVRLRDQLPALPL
jgi:hypothetical protein